MKPTVSVIIPAYNEESNISFIVNDCLEQQQLSYTLKEIIVISDGSTDKTSTTVSAIKDSRINLIIYNNRQGKASRVSEAYIIAKGSIIINLDADIRITASTLFETIVQHHTKEKLDVVCGLPLPVEPKTFIEKIALFGYNTDLAIKDTLGDHGMRYRFIGRIFSSTKQALEGIRIPDNVATDIYTYYFFKTKELHIAFDKNLIVLFKLPTTLRDILNQYKRHFKTNHHLYFSKKIVNEADTKSMKNVILVYTKKTLLHPILGISFAFLCLLAFLNSRKFSRIAHWQYISSTKNIS